MTASSAGAMPRYISKQAVKHRRPKPVFTSSENAWQGDVLGRFIRKNGTWTLLINAKMQQKFAIVVPADNLRYAVIQN